MHENGCTMMKIKELMDKYGCDGRFLEIRHEMNARCARCCLMLGKRCSIDSININQQKNHTELANGASAARHDFKKVLEKVFVYYDQVDTLDGPDHGDSRGKTCHRITIQGILILYVE